MIKGEIQSWGCEKAQIQLATNGHVTLFVVLQNCKDGTNSRVWTIGSNDFFNDINVGTRAKNWKALSNQMEVSIGCVEDLAVSLATKWGPPKSSYCFGASLCPIRSKDHHNCLIYALEHIVEDELGLEPHNCDCLGVPTHWCCGVHVRKPSPGSGLFVFAERYGSKLLAAASAAYLAYTGLQGTG